MPFAKKLFIYATGFLLGLTLLWALGVDKRTSADTKPAYRRPIQEQDLKSKRPVDPLLAFYYIEQPKPYGLKRVLVYDRVGPSGFIRVEEKLSNSQPKRVLSRQTYLANRLELEIGSSLDASSFQALLEKHRLRVIESHSEGHRYTVELPSPSFPMYHHTLQALKANPLLLQVRRIPFS